MPKNPLTAKLIRQIKHLDDLLKTKKGSDLQKMAGIYDTALEKMKASYTRLTALNDQFENTISQKKKERLFTRETPSVESFDITLLDRYIAAVPDNVKYSRTEKRLPGDPQKRIPACYRGGPLCGYWFWS